MRHSDRNRQADEAKPFPLWMMVAGGAGAGLAVGIVVLVLLAAGGGSDGPAPTSEKRVEVKSDRGGKRGAGRRAGKKGGNRPKSPPRHTDELDEFDEGEEELPPQKQFENAMAYFGKHPDQYDEAIRRLTIVLRRYKDRFKEDVSREIGRIRSVRNEKARREFESRKLRADALLRDGKLGEARRVMQEFPDAFMESTAMEDVRAYVEAVVDTAMDRLDAARDKAEALADKGDFDGAVALLRPILSLGIEEAADQARHEISRLERRKKREADAVRRAEEEERNRVALEGDRLFAPVAEDVHRLLARRDYDGAAKRLGDALTGAKNPRLSERIGQELRYLRRIRSVFALAERGLPVLEGKTVTVRLSGKERSGRIVRVGGDNSRWGLKTGPTSVGLNVRLLVAADVDRLCRAAKPRAGEYLALALFLMAEGLVEPARDALARSGLSNDQLEARLKVAGVRTAGRAVESGLAEAEALLAKEDWKRAEERLTALAGAHGGSLSDEQARRLDELRIECATLKSGIRRSFRGKAWTLPGGRTRIHYDFESPEQLKDWTAGGEGNGAASMGVLELAGRTVLWTRCTLKPPLEISFRASGPEIDLNLGGKGEGEWKDGLHWVIGRGNQVILHKNGKRIGTWRLAFERDRTYRVRLKADALLTLWVDGREVASLKNASGAGVLTGRVGLWGVKPRCRFDDVRIEGGVEIPPEAALPEVKPLPKSPLRLLGRSLDEGWKKWKGNWDAKRSEIHGQGHNVALIATAPEAYVFEEYAFEVEVKLLRVNANPGLVFRFGGHYPVWIFGKDGGQVRGIADVTSMAHQLEQKWTRVAIVCRNGRVEGRLGGVRGKRCWVSANPASARTPFKYPKGFGLFVAGGQGVFRNPRITLLK